MTNHSYANGKKDHHVLCFGVYTDDKNRTVFLSGEMDFRWKISVLCEPSLKVHLQYMRYCTK